MSGGRGHLLVSAVSQSRSSFEPVLLVTFYEYDILHFVFSIMSILFILWRIQYYFHIKPGNYGPYQKSIENARLALADCTSAKKFPFIEHKTGT
jgi:hypothetical protein